MIPEATTVIRSPGEIVAEIRDLREQVALIAARLNAPNTSLDERRDAKRDIALAQWQINRLERDLARPTLERR